MINIIDLFAGCGGLLEGFEQTNMFHTVACVEWEKAPCLNLVKRMSEKWGYRDASDRVLRFDMQRTKELISGWENDLCFGSSEGLDKLVQEVKEIDLIIGGPPCQAYSVAGRIRDEAGMKNDYRNYLFESYLSIVEHYRPKAFVFENVPGILSAHPINGPIVDLIKQGFKNIGYEVTLDLKDALVDLTKYGIPQKRKRVIILGLNNDVYKDYAQPMIRDFYKNILPQHQERVQNVKETIGALPKLFPLENNIKLNGRKYSHSMPTPFIENHLPRWHSKRDIEIFRMLAEDIETGAYRYLSTDSLKILYTETTGRVSNIHKYHVIRWHEPSNTIPAHLFKDGLRHIHPDSKQARTITVREAAKLQTFPDDFVFVGNQTDQFKMIGNAVPPKFAFKLALAINQLLNKNNNLFF